MSAKIILKGSLVRPVLEFCQREGTRFLFINLMPKGLAPHTVFGSAYIEEENEVGCVSSFIATEWEGDTAPEHPVVVQIPVDDLPSGYEKNNSNVINDIVLTTPNKGKVIFYLDKNQTLKKATVLDFLPIGINGEWTDKQLFEEDDNSPHLPIRDRIMQEMIKNRHNNIVHYLYEAIESLYYGTMEEDDIWDMTHDYYK